MEISKSGYLALIGLRVLADGHMAQMKDIEKAARAITKEEDDFGHTRDMLYASSTVNEMLDLLKITVEGGTE